MALNYCCEAALGLPDLDCAQRWQSSSSFSDLDFDMTQSGTATASWVGCDLLLEHEADEEYSSELLPQEYGLSQPMTTIDTPFCTGTSTTPTSTLYQRGTRQSCVPATSATASAGNLASLSQGSTHCMSDDTVGSPVSACKHTLLVAVAAAFVPGASSRAGTPEPEAALAPSAQCSNEEEAVHIAALALQMSQGDANAAMAQLLAWAAAR